ncbi:MarR family transcriptional regulator [soil metagenome]
MFVKIYVPTLDVYTIKSNMKDIGDEIKQTKFKSDIEKAVINLVFTANWLNLRNTQLFKEFGLSPQQFNVLRILRGQHPEPATVNLISIRMLDKSSNASRLVDKLIIKELVERKTCPNDRRAVDILITKKGLEALLKLDSVIKEFHKKLSKNISAEEAKLLNELLNKIRK